MKTENLSIGLRALYHAIEWLTVFLILLIFAVQIITPLYAVRVGRADTFLQQLQWLPYRPGVLALGVLLADDQELIRQSLSFVMSKQEDIEMVGTAANGCEALELVEEKQPDVVLLDIRMPEMDGVECTRRIKQEFPGIKVIILTTFDDDDYVFDALRYGASGYLLKGVSVDGLTNAVREAARGGSIIAPDVASKVLQMFSRMAQGDVQVRVNKKNALELTKMEWQVIREVGCGLSNKEIAGRLYLSEGTVRNYISSILRKLELRDRTQLAIWAVQNQNSQPEADV